MTEITYEYWNKLAEQVILISSLLAGFSIAVIANILVADMKNRLSKWIMMSATSAGSFFLITVFAMTKLLLMTTEGYPITFESADLLFPRLVGMISFFAGIISLLTMISLAGWTKSKKMGKMTTAFGILTLIFILLMTT